MQLLPFDLKQFCSLVLDDIIYSIVHFMLHSMLMSQENAKELINLHYRDFIIKQNI